MKVEKFIEALLRWKWYPDILRVPVFLGSFYLIYVLLFGEQATGRNTGLSVMWVLLWSLQPILFVLLGRFWCGICPFSTAGDLVQKAVGNGFHPPLFIKKYGVWFAYFFFLLILVIETLVHMSGSTAASSILVLAIFSMAMISGAFFRRRTWCRYLCPLGVGGGVFSRMRILKLSKDNKLCNNCKDFECIQGSEKAKECPMGLCVRKHDMDADCVSCGNCLKSCPNNAPRIQMHSPVKGFLANVKLSPAEAVFTSSFIGLSVAIYLIKDYVGVINSIVGFHNILLNEILVIIFFTGLSFSLFYLFSHLMIPFTRQSQKYNFRFFGFFLIPYIYFALFNLTAVHEVFLNWINLYNNLMNAMGLNLSLPLSNHINSVHRMHLIQGLGILAGSIISIFFCIHELRKSLHNKQRYKIAAVFGSFLLLITGYSIYLLLFL
jgi:ferredoxin